jgi:hypothetical protein
LKVCNLSFSELFYLRVKVIATVLHRKGQLAPGKIPSATLPKPAGPTHHCRVLSLLISAGSFRLKGGSVRNGAPPLLAPSTFHSQRRAGYLGLSA